MAENALRVFISYSHKDEELRDKLDTHLSNLRWDGVISSWYDRQLTAGMEWDDKIKTELESADIILLLISPDFIASKYCRDTEIPIALKRHEAKQASVVPVILRPFDWTSAPFAKLQTFPKDAKPITTWANQDEAFVSVAQGIRTAAQLMQAYRKQQAEQKQLIWSQYLQKVEEVLSDGVISIVERDTLDELRETLGLTPEEAKEIETHAYEPFSRYEESLSKYKQTLNRLIEKGYYPFNEEIQKDLENRQRDLGVKPEDAAQISKSILDQAELHYQNKEQQLTEPEKLPEQRKQQDREQEKRKADGHNFETSESFSKDGIALNLINGLFDVLSSPNAEISIQNFEEIAHQSLLQNGQIDPNFRKTCFNVAITRLNLYKQPIEIIRKGHTGRTKLGLRGKKENGKEEKYTIARKEDLGGVEGSIRIFFSANGKSAKISGFSL